ncbi:isochorismatase [Blastomyces dermatitidis ER-3]|uniref:Isochorismatase n=1 Tax=Ajellomyces dermatitidis (strain ER-3 / ATCC MYA-2586) TaxID=559297 RepID=A0ABP2ESP6_AJEDR|nr:isochorismatase [Blastomyces dermatitidis ER-3]EEQ86800.2 isochorismatase [Blastomyces dermatitidis ER-3]
MFDSSTISYLRSVHHSGLIQLVHDFDPHEFHTNILALARVVSYFQVPSVLATSLETGPNGPIAKEILETRPPPLPPPGGPLIRRPGQINAMDNEDFVKAIKDTGRKQVVIKYQSVPEHPLKECSLKKDAL